MSAVVAPFGECLRGEGLVWLIGGGGVFAGCLPRVQLFVSTCNGRPHLALQQHWLLPINCHFDDCKARLVRFPCKTRYIRILGFSFSGWDIPQTLLPVSVTISDRAAIVIGGDGPCVRVCVCVHKKLRKIAT